VSLRAETTHLSFAVPGGLISVGTKIGWWDKYWALSGSLQRCTQVRLALHFRFIAIPSDADSQHSKSASSYSADFLASGRKTRNKPRCNEPLLINIGSISTGGRVLSVKADLTRMRGGRRRVALSRRIEKHWRLVGALVSYFPFSLLPPPLSRVLLTPV
jgi:translation initiation factor 2 subunit 3